MARGGSHRALQAAAVPGPVCGSGCAGGPGRGCRPAAGPAAGLGQRLPLLPRSVSQPRPILAPSHRRTSGKHLDPAGAGGAGDWPGKGAIFVKLMERGLGRGRRGPPTPRVRQRCGEKPASPGSTHRPQPSREHPPRSRREDAGSGPGGAGKDPANFSGTMGRNWAGRAAGPPRHVLASWTPTAQGSGLWNSTMLRAGPRSLRGHTDPRDGHPASSQQGQSPRLSPARSALSSSLSLWPPGATRLVPAIVPTAQSARCPTAAGVSLSPGVPVTLRGGRQRGRAAPGKLLSPGAVSGPAVLPSPGPRPGPGQLLGWPWHWLSYRGIWARRRGSSPMLGLSSSGLGPGCQCRGPGCRAARCARSRG